MICRIVTRKGGKRTIHYLEEGTHCIIEWYYEFPDPVTKEIMGLYVVSVNRGNRIQTQRVEGSDIVIHKD